MTSDELSKLLICNGHKLCIIGSNAFYCHNCKLWFAEFGTIVVARDLWGINQTIYNNDKLLTCDELVIKDIIE